MGVETQYTVCFIVSVMVLFKIIPTSSQLFPFQIIETLTEELL